ncbi:DUF7824 domain-containing protein [Streptomyces bambusae]|uniref:DUF7824 domain-containing protein n=1 Tax=Streptomyces bambusae TaxID=1550616 RepID=A0ABS6ZEN5_9ACTN|nr:DUF6493 family protein [Streptomyces bambusae]MBW5486225.1 hypothetical protein [Streptomyces bambusae]
MEREEDVGVGVGVVVGVDVVGDGAGGGFGSPAVMAPAADAQIRGDGGSVMAYEALLDGVVRWSARDRAALAAALLPVTERWTGAHRPRTRAAERLLAVVRSAVGPVGTGTAEPAEQEPARGWLETCQHEAVSLVVGERIQEICAWLRRGETVPMLLAMPSRPSGAVEPRDLVMRLTEYEQAGARPGPADLGQALLRCGGGPADEEVVGAAAELTLPEAPRVVAWLRRGGLPQPEWTVEREPGAPQAPSRRYGARVGRRILVGTQTLEGRGDFPRTYWPLFRRFEPLIGCNHILLGHREQHAAAALPWHPEIVAARLLTEVAAAADRNGASGSPEFLPALARSEGPAGPAVHLGVAYGLGAGPDADRDAAVEALLALAAQGRLDGAFLGGELARLVLLGTLKLPTVTASLRLAAGATGGMTGGVAGGATAGATAGATGGAEAVWPVLASALPELLAAVDSGLLTRLHPPLLALAADCARDCGARGTVAGVDVLAGRPGSSQSVREARRLRATLAGA